MGAAANLTQYLQQVFFVCILLYLTWILSVVFCTLWDCFTLKKERKKYVDSVGNVVRDLEDHFSLVPCFCLLLILLSQYIGKINPCKIQSHQPNVGDEFLKTAILAASCLRY